MIYDTDSLFDFDKLILNYPYVVSGGNHFIKLSIEGAPLYIRPPECNLRGKIVTTSKKSHCDLMFSHENTQFLQWFENLETHICNAIFNKRNDWFEGDMELSDIEDYFASPLKIYKSGKYYLARTTLPTRLGKLNLKFYNENEEEIQLDNLDEDTRLATVLEIQGVKCSARSFQVEMEVKQVMTLSKVNIFESCVFKPTVSSNGTQGSDTDKEMKMKIDEPIENIKCEIEEKDDEIAPTISQDCEKEKEEEDTIRVDTLDETPAINELVSMKANDLDNSENISLHDLECDIHLDGEHCDTIQLKSENDVYFERYKEAYNRAVIAKNLTLQTYLEAQEIKNTYDLDTEFDNKNDHIFEAMMEAQESGLEKNSLEEDIPAFQ